MDLDPPERRTAWEAAREANRRIATDVRLRTTLFPPYPRPT